MEHDLKEIKMDSNKSSDHIAWTVRVPRETRRQAKVLAGVYDATFGAVIESAIEAEYKKAMEDNR